MKRADRSDGGVAAPRATLLDTLRFAGRAILPTLAAGVVLRRRRAMALAQRLQFDRMAVRHVQHLRRRYGPAPLRLAIPGRSVVVLLEADDVRRVLAETPDPFTAATREKKSALGRFQPRGVLLSHGHLRAERRHINEAVLDSQRPLHQLAPVLWNKVEEEAQVIGRAADSTGRLSWDLFNVGWWRLVRRIVLGDAARDDATVTDLLGGLRSSANWAQLGRRRTALQGRFLSRLREHLDRADTDSLAGALARTPSSSSADAAGQVPHWLFAFDAAGIATLRTIALLATHPSQAAHARAEVQQSGSPTPPGLPYLRSCVLEAARLWPTTPLLLRESVAETGWNGVAHPAGTTFLTFTPYFHRDERTGPQAHRFSPEIWRDGLAAEGPALVPFSSGPAQCPGRNLVLFVTTALIAALLRNRSLHLGTQIHLDPTHPLLFTLDHFELSFDVVRKVD